MRGSRLLVQCRLSCRSCVFSNVQAYYPTACYVVCFVFFVCTVGLLLCNLLITYDDDDDETKKPTSPTLKTCEWEQYWIRQTSNLALNTVAACGLLLYKIYAVNTYGNGHFCTTNVARTRHYGRRHKLTGRRNETRLASGLSATYVKLWVFHYLLSHRWPRWRCKQDTNRKWLK